MICFRLVEREQQDLYKLFRGQQQKFKLCLTQVSSLWFYNAYFYLMIRIATIVVNCCNDYVNDSWDRLLIYLRMDSTWWSLDFFQIFSIWKPCCYTCAVLLKSPNWASQQTRANGLVILKPNSKPENDKCRFKMNIWHNLPRYILSLGHPLFSFRLASNAFPDIESVGGIEKKKTW